MWVKAKAASPAQLANPREKDAITTLRSELFMEKSLSSLSFFNPEARVVSEACHRLALIEGQKENNPKEAAEK